MQIETAAHTLARDLDNSLCRDFKKEIFLKTIRKMDIVGI